MRNACIFNTCLVSATNVDVLIKNVKILVADLEEEKKKKKTSVKESRKTAINEEIKLLKNAIAGKQKETERERERVVVEKSLLMRWRNLEICKEICRFWYDEGFAKKTVALKRSCDKTKKEIVVLEQTFLGLEAEKAKL